MNSLFTRYMLICLSVGASSIMLAGKESLSKPELFSRLGGRPVLKETLKELPCNRYETVGEQDIFTIKGIPVLKGQDAIEMLVDAGIEQGNEKDGWEFLKKASKVYVREKILNAACSQAPSLPEKIQENPKLDYTLTTLIKSGARMGIDFTIDSFINTLQSHSEK